MKRKVTVMLLVFALFFAVCGSCALAPTASASGEKFVIGTFLQLTGALPIPGNEAKRSIDMAIKYINANGGFNGVPVEAIYYDTNGSPEEAVKIVQKLIVDHQVDAVIASVNSTEVAATIPYLNEAEVYHFGLGTSPAWMADDSRIWTFRASPNNGRGLASSAESILKLGYKTLAIMAGNSDNAKASADALEALCPEMGLTVITRQTCDADETDFTAQVARVISGDPDIVFLCLDAVSFPQALKQLRMNYRGMLAGMDSLAVEYQELAGLDNCTYYVFAYPYVDYARLEDSTIPIVTEYLERFIAEYGEMPINNTTFRAWDTMMAMWEAAKIAGNNDSNALREATHKVKVPGLGGMIDYTDGSREAYSVFNPFILMDGQYSLLEDWLADGGYEEYLAATGRNR